MKYAEIFAIAADWAAIITAMLTALAYGQFIYHRHSQMQAFEKHLRSEKAAQKDKGQRTALHLAAHLSMTEAEVLGAAFRSKKVAPVVRPNDDGQATTLLFHYVD